jgi:hypothetical protein
MGALVAEILYHQPISPCTQPSFPGIKALWPKIEVSTNLDPRNSWRSLSVIEFTAGQLASPAADAFCWISDYQTFRLIHDDERRFFGTPGIQPGYRNYHDSADQKKLTPRKVLVYLHGFPSPFRNIMFCPAKKRSPLRLKGCQFSSMM